MRPAIKAIAENLARAEFLLVLARGEVPTELVSESLFRKWIPALQANRLAPPHATAAAAIYIAPLLRAWKNEWTRWHKGHGAGVHSQS